MAKLEKSSSKPTAAKGAPSNPKMVKAPAKAVAFSADGQEIDLDRIQFSRRAVAGGFAIVGLVLGYLTGASHWPALPAQLTDALAKTIWVGASLGYCSLDQTMAIPYAVLGGVVGVTLGYTIGQPSRRIVASMVLGGLAMAIGVVGTHNPIIALLGWLLGYAIAMRGPIA